MFPKTALFDFLSTLRDCYFSCRIALVKISKSERSDYPFLVVKIRKWAFCFHTSNLISIYWLVVSSLGYVEVDLIFKRFIGFMCMRVFLHIYVCTTCVFGLSEGSLRSGTGVTDGCGNQTRTCARAASFLPEGHLFRPWVSFLECIITSHFYCERCGILSDAFCVYIDCHGFCASLCWHG